MVILKLNGNQWFDGAQRPARERSADHSGTAVPAPLDDGNECVLRVRAAVNDMSSHMIRYIATAILLVLSGASPAHEFESPVDDPAAAASMRYCQTFAVRAAWGAQARFRGAPATFTYIPEARLKSMFMGDAAEIPGDAIYVLERLSIDQRREYEEAAFYGWKQADSWVREGREGPEYEVLAAVFYRGCTQELTTESARE